MKDKREERVYFILLAVFFLASLSCASSAFLLGNINSCIPFHFMLITKSYFFLIALTRSFVKKIGYFIYEAFTLRNGSIDTGIVI